MLAARQGGRRRAVNAAVGRFRNDMVESSRCFGIGLQQLSGPISPEARTRNGCPDEPSLAKSSSMEAEPGDDQHSSNERERLA